MRAFAFFVFFFLLHNLQEKEEEEQEEEGSISPSGFPFDLSEQVKLFMVRLALMYIQFMKCKYLHIS